MGRGVAWSRDRDQTDLGGWNGTDGRETVPHSDTSYQTAEGVAEAACQPPFTVASWRSEASDFVSGAVSGRSCGIGVAEQFGP